MTPERAAAELRGIDARARSFSNVNVWRGIAEILYEGFTDNFARAATAEGEPWRPRRSKKAQNPLLILSSLLIRSVGGQAESIYMASPMELILGVDGGAVKYAAIHNEGSGDMPQREYLNVPEAVRDQGAEKFVDAFSEHLFPKVSV